LQFSFTIQSLGTQAANPITAGVWARRWSRRSSAWVWRKYVINLMTFDYGSTNVNNCVVANNLCDMGNLRLPLRRRSTSSPAFPLTNWSHYDDRRATLRTKSQQHDIDTIDAFVISNGLPFIAFWSFDRDTPGGAAVAAVYNVPALTYIREFMNSLGVQ